VSVFHPEKIQSQIITLLGKYYSGHRNAAEEEGGLSEEEWMPGRNMWTNKFGFPVPLGEDGGGSRRKSCLL